MIEGADKNHVAVPQIKICGLTVAEQAKACADQGADAIGLVFFPLSPRYVSLDQARVISKGLPVHVPAVGVFVNPDWDQLAHTIEHCHLGGVQLHGSESPEMADRIRATFDVQVLKALFTTKKPGLDDAGQYAVSAFLIECGQGPLPGGNAQEWDWGAAAPFAHAHPTALAGGLNPDNVAPAIGACLPDAVDASSGLEAAPGRKDLAKVERFVAQVRKTAANFQVAGKALRKIF